MITVCDPGFRSSLKRLVIVVGDLSKRYKGTAVAAIGDSMENQLHKPPATSIIENNHKIGSKATDVHGSKLFGASPSSSPFALSLSQISILEAVSGELFSEMGREVIGSALKT